MTNSNLIRPDEVQIKSELTQIFYITCKTCQNTYFKLRDTVTNTCCQIKNFYFPSEILKNLLDLEEFS